MLHHTNLPPLLRADEPPAVEIVNRDSDATLLFVCDHASHRIPHALHDLGLSRVEIEAHIGWDIGAAQLARSLASAFAAPLVLTGYSRLVIDCNRPLVSDGSIPRTSAGIAIAANTELSAAAQKQRQDAFFHPYHDAISELLDSRAARDVPTALFAIHSFTPDYPGEERPWHVDFAYHRDRRLAGLLLDNIDVPGLVVGDNLPYAVEDDSDQTIPQHGERRGLPHVLVEIRQDTLATPTAIGTWSERLIALIDRLKPEIDRLAKESLPRKGSKP
ncbi:MAG: N-formylglutamate amidohydrolase [Rhodospirillaceae bacterium]|nr:N-formylglutamate amidohydrolase [Rhodospirillaceae bacterium]